MKDSGSAVRDSEKSVGWKLMMVRAKGADLLKSLKACPTAVCGCCRTLSARRAFLREAVTLPPRVLAMVERPYMQQYISSVVGIFIAMSVKTSIY